MAITVTGQNSIERFVGSLLSLKEHEVSFKSADTGRNPGTLRLSLPGKWFHLRNVKYGDSIKEGVLLASPKEGQVEDSLKRIRESLSEQSGSEVVLFDSLKNREILEGVTVTGGLSLIDLTSFQEDSIELHSNEPVFIFEKTKTLKKLLSSLKFFGIKVLFVDNLEPYQNSRFISHLLYLPVALCNTTMNNFLSYTEGRKIISYVLNEGIKTFEGMDKKMARLPVNDPRKLAAKLMKQPDSFNFLRYSNDRCFNPLLESLILGKKSELAPVNQEFIDISAMAGMEASWNRKLMAQFEIVKRRGFYESPADLLKCIE